MQRNPNNARQVSQHAFQKHFVPALVLIISGNLELFLWVFLPEYMLIGRILSAHPVVPYLLSVFIASVGYWLLRSDIKNFIAGDQAGLLSRKRRGVLFAFIASCSIVFSLYLLLLPILPDYKSAETQKVEVESRQSGNPQTTNSGREPYTEPKSRAFAVSQRASLWALYCIGVAGLIAFMLVASTAVSDQAIAYTMRYSGNLVDVNLSVRFECRPTDNMKQALQLLWNRIETNRLLAEASKVINDPFTDESYNNVENSFGHMQDIFRPNTTLMQMIDVKNRIDRRIPQIKSVLEAALHEACTQEAEELFKLSQIELRDNPLSAGFLIRAIKSLEMLVGGGKTITFRVEVPKVNYSSEFNHRYKQVRDWFDKIRARAALLGQQQLAEAIQRYLDGDLAASRYKELMDSINQMGNTLVDRPFQTDGQHSRQAVGGREPRLSNATQSAHPRTVSISSFAEAIGRELGPEPIIDERLRTDLIALITSVEPPLVFRIQRGADMYGLSVQDIVNLLAPSTAGENSLLTPERIVNTFNREKITVWTEI